jgi:hypothetical protein
MALRRRKAWLRLSLSSFRAGIVAEGPENVERPVQGTATLPISAHDPYNIGPIVPKFAV